MSQRGTTVAVVASAIGLGVIGYLTWALFDMKSQRDLAVANHAALAKQLAAIGSAVGGIVPKVGG